MDKKDAWLLELYEGSGKPSDPGSGNTEEAASLREMKDWLDARSAIRSTRPDPEAVEAVLQAAAQSAQPAGARQDRPALSRKRVVWRVPRRIAGGAIAAMLAAVVVVGLFRADVFAPTLTDSEPGALRPDASVSTEAVPSEASPETLSPAEEAENRGADVQPGNAGLAAASSPDLPASAGAPPLETAVEAPSPTVLADASSADAAGPLQSAAAVTNKLRTARWYSRGSSWRYRPGTIRAMSYLCNSAFSVSAMGWPEAGKRPRCLSKCSLPDRGIPG